MLNAIGLLTAKEFEVTQIADGLLVAKTRTTDIELAVATKTYLNGQPLKKVESGNSEIFKESIEVDLLKTKKFSLKNRLLLLVLMKPKTLLNLC